MAAEITSSLKEAPRSVDRLLDTVIGLGESRLTKAIAFLQLPIYAGFMHAAMNEGMSWWGAALHPVLTLGGGLDSLLSGTETANQLVFALTLGELKTIGLATLLTVGTATVDRMGKISRGELPIIDPDGVLFFSAGFDLPLGEAIGKAVVGNVDTPGAAGNLYFAALYGNEQNRPSKPGQAFKKRHYIAPADLQLNVTDTEVLRPTGALTAKTVILAAPNDRVLEDIAITIKQQRGDEVRIIPLPQQMTSFEPYTTIDLDTGERTVLTEAPINPFRSLTESVSQMNDASKHQQLAHMLTDGLPSGLRESRQRQITKKLAGLSSEKIKVFLNGSDGGEKQALVAAFNLDTVKDKVSLVKSAKKANLVLSFGKGEVTDDVSVSQAAEDMKEAIFADKIDTLHLGLPFSWGNEDSVGAHAEGVISIQRLLAEEIAQRIKGDFSKELSFREKLRQSLRGTVSKLRGQKIRQRLS